MTAPYQDSALPRNPDTGDKVGAGRAYEERDGGNDPSTRAVALREARHARDPAGAARSWPRITAGLCLGLADADPDVMAANICRADEELVARCDAIVANIDRHEGNILVQLERAVAPRRQRGRRHVPAG